MSWPSLFQVVLPIQFTCPARRPNFHAGFAQTLVNMDAGIYYGDLGNDVPVGKAHS